MPNKVTYEKEAEDFLATKLSILGDNDLLKLKLGDFAKFLPEEESPDSISKEAVAFLAKLFESLGVQTEPRLRKGIVQRSFSNPIFLYRCSGDFDHSTQHFKQGLLMVRLAVITALSDGDAADDELEEIKKIIWGQNIFSLPEKKSLYAKASYLMLHDYEEDERGRDYRRKFLSKTSFLEKFAELEAFHALRMLELAKDIVIADHFLDRGELKLLQEMYKIVGLSARSTESDLLKYANEKHILLETFRAKISETSGDNDNDDFGDVLGELLAEFDDF